MRVNAAHESRRLPSSSARIKCVYFALNSCCEKMVRRVSYAVADVVVVVVVILMWGQVLLLHETTLGFESIE